MEASEKLYNEVFKQKNEPTLKLPEKLPIPKVKHSYKDFLSSVGVCPCDSCKKFNECADKELACEKFLEYVLNRNDRRCKK